MRREALSSVCSMALLIWGCPKRQTTLRVVYVPSPPPAAAPAPMEEGGTLIIEEPAPPEPEETEVVPAEAPTPEPERRHRRPLRTEPAATSEPAPEPVEPPLAEVPALEPLESQEQQSALRHQVVTLQENLRQRIQQLNRQGLDPAARRTLEDARAFLSQSGRALDDEDLQRSLILARKASLLVSALEKER